MRAHVFQHVPFEYIGNIEEWLSDHGYWITRTRFFDDPAMPAPGDIDLLIIIGGPMSVNDETEYPWLKDEKWAIRQYMLRGVPIIGICLGAQLIAAACGAKVYPAEEKELGWFPIQSVPDMDNTGVFNLPDELSVFHWHGETFDLPEQAILLASSKGCANQAFQIGPNVIGMQCHLETTPESAASLVDHCRGEITGGPCMQDADSILNTAPGHYEKIREQMHRLLDYVTRRERQ